MSAERLPLLEVSGLHVHFPIYGGVLLHCAVAWTMDALALAHRGDLARLLGSG